MKNGLDVFHTSAYPPDRFWLSLSYLLVAFGGFCVDYCFVNGLWALPPKDGLVFHGDALASSVHEQIFEWSSHLVQSDGTVYSEQTCCSVQNCLQYCKWLIESLWYLGMNLYSWVLHMCFVFEYNKFSTKLGITKQFHKHVSSKGCFG